MAKRWALSTGNLSRGGLPRNSVDRITDRPDMTSAVDRGRKALTQTNKSFFALNLRCGGEGWGQGVNFVFVCLMPYVPVSNFSVILGRLPGFNGDKV